MRGGWGEGGVRPLFAKVLYVRLNTVQYVVFKKTSQRGISPLYHQQQVKQRIKSRYLHSSSVI